jgi:CHAT domain-containing protein
MNAPQIWQQPLAAARAAASAASSRDAQGAAFQRLAFAALDAYTASGQLDLLDEAVAAGEASLRATPPATGAYAARANDYGFLLRQRYDERRQQADLWRAESALRTAYGGVGNRADLERSVDLDEQALAAIPPGHPDRVHLLGNAANGQSHLSSARDAHWNRAIGLWREAIQLGIEQQPVAALVYCLNWLNSALDRKAAQDATDAAVFAEQTLDRLVAAQQSRSEQEVWLRQAASLPSLAAQVYVETGSPERAVLAVEHTRAALLTATLATTGGGETVTLGQLRDIARRQGPLVYLVPCGRAMALTVDADGVSILPLPALTEEAVAAAVGDLYGSYYRRKADVESWKKAFDKVSRWLWTAVMAPLLSSLGAHRQVNLLPGGALALLPLHAAWEPAGRTATGRRYAGDDILITLQPTAKVMLRPPPATPARAGQLVAVAEPRPTSQRPLRWAVAEARAAEVLFRDRDPKEFFHEKAKRDDVLPAMAEARVIHLACHGTMRLEEPFASGLVLAGDQLLTVSSVLETRLRAHLVVASACESASIPADLADQVVNFAAALLHAGSHAVLATAFAVDDFTALMLATRFYAEWRTGIPGAQALRAAVAFLRDTTKAEKVGWVQELRNAGWPADVTTSLATGLELASDRSFAHPVQWAPFVWWGQHVTA